MLIAETVMFVVVVVGNERMRDGGSNRPGMMDSTRVIVGEGEESRDGRPKRFKREEAGERMGRADSQRERMGESATSKNLELPSLPLLLRQVTVSESSRVESTTLNAVSHSPSPLRAHFASVTQSLALFHFGGDMKAIRTLTKCLV